MKCKFCRAPNAPFRIDPRVGDYRYVCDACLPKAINQADGAGVVSPKGLAAEQWWARQAELLAEKMRLGGVKSFGIRRTERGTYEFEIIPVDGPPPDSQSTIANGPVLMASSGDVVIPENCVGSVRLVLEEAAAVLKGHSERMYAMAAPEDFRTKTAALLSADHVKKLAWVHSLLKPVDGDQATGCDSKTATGGTPVEPAGGDACPTRGEA